MARHYLIKGGQPLRGEISLAGAKNAAGKLILATLLTDQGCEISNLPVNGESEIALEIAQKVGATHSPIANTVNLATKEIKNNDLSNLSSKNRLSVLAIGPLLFRTGQAKLPRVGGDKIGARPVNWHITALKTLGAEVTETENSYEAKAASLVGAKIELPFPSVGATETVLLSASWARGETILSNAAVEPEVIQLADFLNLMGGNIQYSVSKRTYLIKGVDKFEGAKIEVIPDRLEAVSYASIALASRGEISVLGARKDLLEYYLDFVNDIGGHYEIEGGGIRFWADGELKPTRIKTSTHPGFMTDWQQPSAVVLTTATGQSQIHETVHDTRMEYLEDIKKMGAKIEISSNCPVTDPCRYQGKNFRHVATITGPSKLRGRSITTPDIRAGMAYVVASLIATGESKIYGIEHLERGYEQLPTKLRSLGASITQVE